MQREPREQQGQRVVPEQQVLQETGDQQVPRAKREPRVLPVRQELREVPGLQGRQVRQVLLEQPERLEQRVLLV